MKKIIAIFSLLSISLSALGATGPATCTVSLVKRDGTSKELVTGHLKTSSRINARRFDTYQTPEDDFRVVVTVRNGVSTSIELLDRVGGGYSFAQTQASTDANKIFAWLESYEKYQVMGDSSNFRLYLECK